MNNIVFYFSGTGNSLYVAKTIADELGNCEIISMAKSENYVLSKNYDNIGFIYPNYFCGLPKRVIKFIENIDLSNNLNTYYFSIATIGGNIGNAVYQMYELFFNRHGIKINNCQKLKMYQNYVNFHKMKKNVSEITKKSNERLIPIISSIKNKETCKPTRLFNVLRFVNKNFLKKVSNLDNYYSINSNCSGCGICKEVCPVKNIEMINKKPAFKHNCEQCVACIQYCPQRAIDYKNLTQKRGRYTHPEINYKELIKYNNM